MNYEKKSIRVNKINSFVKRIEAVLLIFAFLFVGSTVYDMYAFTGAGLGSEDFPGFAKLQKENKDTVAWIKMDGTHINHPVVHGVDNFEYINKGFDGKFYQGGCIFLDEKNSDDLSENYIIIHGHHMSRGAMFSDIANYVEEDFFNDNKTGELLTPKQNYSLTVIGVKIVNAYAGEIYYTEPGITIPLHLITDCIHQRNVQFGDKDKLVLLSTCAGDMTNDRVVVFCRAREM